jgi:hypothetical protein
MNYIYLAPFHVYIDGKKEEKVFFRKSKTVEVAPGSHNIQIKVGSFDFYQSPVETYSVAFEEEIRIGLRSTWFGVIYNLAFLALAVIFIMNEFRNSDSPGNEISVLFSWAFLVLLIGMAFRQSFVVMDKVD